MIEFCYTVKDPVGIHARPAGMLAKKAKEFNSEIILSKGEKSANATRLMSVMGLCVKGGDSVRVTVNGRDEERAAEEIRRFFEQTL